jgi:hypothetical protein
VQIINNPSHRLLTELSVLKRYLFRDARGSLHGAGHGYPHLKASRSLELFEKVQDSTCRLGELHVNHIYAEPYTECEKLVHEQAAASLIYFQQ